MSATAVTQHRTPRRRARPARRSGRVRALLALGAVAVLATGLSIKGTFAFWTDSATLNTGSFTSGTLDITLNGGLTGPGGSTSLSALSLTNMVPGESRSADFAVGNAGSVGLTWTATGTATGTGTTFYTVQLFTGTANPQTGTAAGGNRGGTCSGSALGTAQTLGATAAALSASARPLGAAASENVCAVVTLPSTVDNTAQGKTFTASLVFDAKQVGAP